MAEEMPRAPEEEDKEITWGDTGKSFLRVHLMAIKAAEHSYLSILILPEDWQSSSG